MTGLWIAAALFALYWAAVYGVYRFAIVRRGGNPNVTEIHYKPLLPYKEEAEAGIRWFLDRKPESVSIRSYDGLTLRGYWLEHPQAKGAVVLMHGHRSSWATDFSCVFRFYYERGYSVLACWQRAHGESEGEHICFGVKERFDCRDWVRFLETRIPADQPVFLDGVSMGAATVLMAAGLSDLPDCVRGVIADSGFTSAWDEFASILKRLHLPLHPLMDSANWMARRLAGFDFRECSTLDAVRETKLPLLLVHGEADTYVPPEFSRQNFEACCSEKRLVTVSGAVHGMSYLVDRNTCQRELLEFLKLYGKKEAAV